VEEGDPRPLTQAERAVLEALLAADFEGAPALREQMKSVQVVGRCKCGCPSVDLRPGRRTPAAGLKWSIVPVEAETPPGDDGLPYTIILFAHGGRLSYLECVWHGDEPPSTWPNPVDLTVKVADRYR
jgi:hypothetical protein